MSNDTVKIGASLNPASRISAIEHASGLFVRRCFESKPVPDATAFAIERACHDSFAVNRTIGEFFKISFADAVAEINRQVTEYADANILPLREKIQFLLDAAKLAKGAMRERFLLKVEALLDGRELLDFDESIAATDFVADFVDKHCVRDQQARISRPQLIRLIRSSCPEAEDVSNKAISKMLDSIAGLSKVKIHGDWHIKGIKLIDNNDH